MRSARAAFAGVVFVNAHGGNEGALAAAPNGLWPRATTWWSGAPRCRAGTPTPGGPRRRCCSPSNPGSCASTWPSLAARSRSPRCCPVSAPRGCGRYRPTACWAIRRVRAPRKAGGCSTILVDDLAASCRRTGARREPGCGRDGRRARHGCRNGGPSWRPGGRWWRSTAPPTTPSSTTALHRGRVGRGGGAPRRRRAHGRGRRPERVGHAGRGRGGRRRTSEACRRRCGAGVDQRRPPGLGDPRCPVGRALRRQRQRRPQPRRGRRAGPAGRAAAPAGTRRRRLLHGRPARAAAASARTARPSTP